MGIKSLSKIQLGQEVTAGTPVAATALWMGRGKMEDLREPTRPDEDVALLVPTTNIYTPWKGASLAMEDIEATFEQFPYILSASLEKVVDGVADGAGSGLSYTYDIAEAAEQLPQTYTIEGGDDTQAEEMEYAYVESFKLTGGPKAAVMMGATWQGRQVTKTSFTGAVAIPIVEHVLFGKSTLSIDTVGGTFGDTEVSSVLLGFDLAMQDFFSQVPAANGDLYFAFLKAKFLDGSLGIRFEHNSDAVAEKDKWVANTPSLIQIRILGDLLETAGTAYTNKELTMNFAGYWEDFGPLEADEGNNVLTGQFRIAYDKTAGTAGQILVVNELAALL